MTSRLLPPTALVVGFVACAGIGPHAAARPAPTLSSIAYDARVVSTAPWVLEVDLTLEGGARSVRAGAPAGVVSVEVDDGRGARPAEWGDRGAFRVDCEATCRVHYRYDLSVAAAASQDAYEVAVRSGPDLVAPLSSWLLWPEPLVSSVPVRVSIRAPSGVRFATGLGRAARGVYEARSEEIPTLGWGAFGSFEVKRIRAPGGAVDVAILGGSREASDDLLLGWTSDMAVAQASVFGRFPVPRAALFLLPVPDERDVTNGITLPAGGASILVAVGAEAGERELYADWILAHELFHLGVPSFFREGSWLDEGLATYYEPLLRARAGLLGEDAVWASFSAGMPRGLPRGPRARLVDDADHDRIYWGGAAFAFAADVLIRERSGGARSLDDGLRAVLAEGGDATRVWTVARFLEVVDAAAGAPVTQELYARVARAPGCPASLPAAGCAPNDGDALAGLFRSLGVDRAGEGVALREDAPRAALRRRITRR